MAAESVSEDGQTVKWLWALADGARVETVLMHYPDRATVCVSSQAGCAMGCSFCATGQAGFARHLSTGEIVEQVIAARRAARPSRLSNVVFMGMGEPLANYDRVWGAVERLHQDRRAVRPPPDHLHRGGGARASAGWPANPSRSIWPSRCTPPTTACATPWCRSTAAIPCRC